MAYASRHAIEHINHIEADENEHWEVAVGSLFIGAEDKVQAGGMECVEDTFCATLNANTEVDGDELLAEVGDSCLVVMPTVH